MMPRHHLDPSTLVSYAAGALPLELSVVVATHLDACPHCRRQAAAAESIGGLLVEQQHGAAAHPAALRMRMLEQLDDTTSDITVHDHPRAGSVDEPARDQDLLPTPLHPYFGTSYRALKWRWISPGVHCIRAEGTSTLLLLRIAPGKSMPLHSHGSTEVTQILQGAYHDALGHFAPGDVADLDSDIEHQPVTAPGIPCICVSALDAPLRFNGWLARKLQPLFKI